MYFSIYRLSLFLALISLLSSTYGQPSSSPFNLHPPLKGELTLSGSFGEIRTNSFHSGIDFRTGGVIGQRVYASDNGFVSRVRVSGTGFGKAIYIQHPNGLTTVYAHMHRFTAEIDAYIKEHQYKNKSFEIDLQHLTLNDFPIKRGQFIGLSGNTGSSGGPHLHYEVRLTKQQIPLNPAFSNLPITDIFPPTVSSAWLYALDSSSFINGINANKELLVHKQGINYFVKDTIKFQGVVGLGIKAYDFVNTNSLRCGIYSIKMYVNNRLFYHFSLDEFSFAETRYVNSHTDFALRQHEGKRVHRLLKEPNNRFNGYKTLVNNGTITSKEDSVYNIRIVVSDAYMNTSELSLLLRGEYNLNTPPPTSPPVLTNKPYWLFFKDNHLATDWFKIHMPKNFLYRNLFFTHGYSEHQEGMLSPIIHIHNKYVPVHRAYSLSIMADSIPQELIGKAIVGTFNSKGDIISAGGKYSNGFIETKVDFFGDFFLLVDTVAPTITPINIQNNKNMARDRIIQFTVDDNLSGIASIEGIINENWALLEYDPKNKLVFYELDSDKLTRNQHHYLVLKVIDNVGNTKEYSCTFYW